MELHKPPLSMRSPLLRDFELESALVGPSTRMLLLESDPQGGIYYQFEHHQAHSIQLPGAFASRPLAVLDMIRSASIIDAKTNRLEVLTAYLSSGNRLFLFGANWGKWIDEMGQTHTAPDIPSLLIEWRVPVTVYESRKMIGLSFQINIYHRDIFTRETLNIIREGPVRHVMELLFHYPSGEFRLARVQVEDLQTHRVGYNYDLTEFPLLWPPLVKSLGELQEAKDAPPRKPDSSKAEASASQAPNSAGFNGEKHHPEKPEPQEIPRAKLAKRPDSSTQARPEPEVKRSQRPESRPGPTPEAKSWTPRPEAARPAPGVQNRERSQEAPLRPINRSSQPLPSHPATPAPPEPPKRLIPRTEHLSTHELLSVLSTETDPEHRWKMIEANLILGRPQRTYPLILHYAEMIAERTVSWPPVRLKVAFAHQPGAVLIGIMYRWHVNQILTIVEENAESERILEWLREREIERLLKLDLTNAPVSVEAARMALRIDRNAEETSIKKVWRTLLGFMNADHGRSEERAIHRKKDEIAKHLQMARNLLLKSR